MVHVVWFKKDLRTFDHAPLHAASLVGPVVPLYVVEPSVWSHGDLSVRHYQFVKESLADLNRRLKKLNQSIYLIVSEMIPVLEKLFATYGPFTMHSHMEHGLTHTYHRDMAVKKWMKNHACVWHEYPGDAVLRGRYVSHRPTFMKTYLSPPVIPVPKSLDKVSCVPRSFQGLAALDAFTPPGILAEAPIKGGESEAIKHANAFFKTRYKTYQMAISKPIESLHTSSFLSAYLTWGNISIRSLHKATEKHLNELKMSDQTFYKKQLTAFHTRLFWRSHFVEKNEMKPWIDHVSKDPRYQGIRTNNPDMMTRFTAGRTGFPFVDACIRHLHRTSWLNFRQRAMLTSFACNTLLLDWRTVGQFLARQWIDYEPGIHWSQIQMQAGLIPPRHIPIYDVIKQSKETDPKGDFIRLNVPELSHLHGPEIHEPWLLDSNPYLAPMIEYATVLQASKETLYAIKKTPQKIPHI